MISALRVQPFDDPTWDPGATLGQFLGVGVVRDPYPQIAELRQRSSVHRIDMRRHLGAPPDILVEDLDKYAVLGWHEVREVFETPTVFSSSVTERTTGRMFGRFLGVMDAPEHSRWRPFFMKAFLPNVVAKWGESYVDPIVTTLIDRFIGRGKADLVNEFAVYYPFLFICRQLGLVPADEDIYLKMTQAMLLVSIDPPHAEEAKVKLGDYYRARIAECRGTEGDDMITRLANAEIDGEYLPDEIVVSFLRLLLSAASDTTFRTTSNLFTALLMNPGQLEALRKDRSLVAAAIEEVLRWEAPVTFIQRIAFRDHELGGVNIPQGALVEVWNGAANRDPGHYPEPDRFDLFRKRDRHFAFASGPHVCLGQHLARVEMTRAVNAVLDRLPNLRLDTDQPPPQIVGINGRAPAAVHARFG
jgi:cytochrome P450